MQPWPLLDLCPEVQKELGFLSLSDFLWLLRDPKCWSWTLCLAFVAETPKVATSRAVAGATEPPSWGESSRLQSSRSTEACWHQQGGDSDTRQFCARNNEKHIAPEVLIETFPRRLTFGPWAAFFLSCLLDVSSLRTFCWLSSFTWSFLQWCDKLHCRLSWQDYDIASHWACATGKSGDVVNEDARCFECLFHHLFVFLRTSNFEPARNWIGPIRRMKNASGTMAICWSIWGGQAAQVARVLLKDKSSFWSQSFLEFLWWFRKMPFQRFLLVRDADRRPTIQMASKKRGSQGPCNAKEPKVPIAPGMTLPSPGS